jgi:hypothetical protein
VLFALARVLGEAWPGDVPRDLVLARAFGAGFVDESHRARLRVEIGRHCASQRTVQRALDSLAAEGKEQSFGRARSRRWITAPAGIHDDLVTQLLHCRATRMEA